ncbi:MAG: hypothetical protein KDK89_07345 [Alphaproteobacteria bacterium]|nr:hypothetical protein [Alphaproteobacteria bacterium]
MTHSDPSAIEDRQFRRPDVSSEDWFDEAYYVSCYRELIGAGMSPKEHFLKHGLHLGLKPTARFDPLAYRILRPDVQIDELAQRISSGEVSDTPGFKQLFPSVPRLPYYMPKRRIPKDDAENIADPAQYGLEYIFQFQVNGRDFQLVAPRAQMLLDRLTYDRPFAFARISQGDWDCFHAFFYYRDKLYPLLAQGGFSEADIDRLALRYCDEVIGHYENFVENFTTELMHDLKGKEHSPSFMRAVSFKGYPTFDERLFEWSSDSDLDPTEIKRLHAFSQFFDTEEILYDATLWKRWLIAGQLGALPALARERPVILMGAERVASLGERWQLPWFHHIAIPPTASQPRRYELLDLCRTRLAEAKWQAAKYQTKRPLFILQGSSFAYWFMVRMFATDPDVFYIDLGQALHPWFYDVKSIPLGNWGRIFSATILQGNGLEPYYRDRGIADPIAHSLFGDPDVPPLPK